MQVPGGINKYINKLTLSGGIKPATDQKFSTSRSNVTNKHTNLLLRNATNALFERLWNQMPDTVLQEILFNCDLKTILFLRLVSTKWSTLAASIVTDNQYSPLANRAIIPFKYSKLYQPVKQSKQAKFKFAKLNTQVKVKISMDELLSLLSIGNAQSLLHSIPEKNLQIVLKIKNLDELNLFCSLLSDQKNKKFITKIVELNLKKIEINDDTIDAINSLLNNLLILPKLSTLSLGDVASDATLGLFKAFNNLTALSFGNIATDVILTIPNLPPYLTNLSFEIIWNNAVFNLLHPCPHLTTLSFTTIDEDVTLNLHNLFPNLTTVSLESINPNAINSLLSLFPDITTLALGSIFQDLTLVLPDSKLTTLFLGEIFNNVTFTLTILSKNLTSLSVEGISENATLILSNSSKNLLSLSCKTIVENATLNLPNALPNLTTLCLGHIYGPFTINLPNVLPKLATIAWQYISDDAKFVLAKLLEKLEHIQSESGFVRKHLNLLENEN